jgi:glycosyltransferase involved in cell wall biosynthesis
VTTTPSTDASDPPRTVLVGLLFHPRGGSAQVARSLSHALERSDAGLRARIVTGSLGVPGDRSHAETFYDGLHVVAGAYDDAYARWQRGEDPMEAPFPFHPSYESREGVPDRSFAQVTPEQGEHAIEAWTQLLRESNALDGVAVAHLHHLTPLHAAVRRVAPDLPIVTHLHGTELKFIAAAEEGSQWWREQMLEWARSSAEVICVSPHDLELAQELLGIDPQHIRQLPNGVDTELFQPRTMDPDERLHQWERWLVDDPRGWSEADPTSGSIVATDSELEAFRGQPVLIYTGRFLHFKRVPLLVRAYARARKTYGVRAPLVIWGGSPGEWEGEHPHTVALELGVEAIFFGGWRTHEDLALALTCSDVLVAPSVDEPFGLVYLEAMASGMPVIGTNSGGPPSFVNVVPGEPDGWLVTPDDEEALCAAIVEAVHDNERRITYGANAAAHIRATYSWDRLAELVLEVYASAMR